MNELVKLARLGVAALIKEHEDAALGRTPTDINVGAGPSVPPEDMITTREPQTIIHEAIQVLEQGLQDIVAENQDAEELVDPNVHMKGALTSTEHNEVSSSVAYMRKAVFDNDTPITVKAIIKDDQGRTLILRSAYSEFWGFAWWSC